MTCDHAAFAAVFTTDLQNVGLIDIHRIWAPARRTFSAGAELANNLRELNRATLVGEITRGAANPAGSHRVSGHLRAFDTAYRLAFGHVLELGNDGARRTIAEQARQALAHLAPA